MSGHFKKLLLPPFSTPATQVAVEASTESYPAEYVASILLEIGGYLISLDEQTTLFGQATNSPHSPSLRTLHDRLHNGQLNPAPIQSHANETKRIKATLGQRTTKNAIQRPLEDFEDLYYAVLARMQGIHQILNARLGSGFSSFTDLVHSGGPSIADLYTSLAQYWGALNQHEFVKAVDCAVRNSRVRYLHQEIVTQVHNDDITRNDAEELLNDLFNPKEYASIQGLAWVSGWAPSMVSAWLEEKYRMVLLAEKEAAEGKSRMEMKRAKIGGKVQKPQYKVRSRKEGAKSVHQAYVAGGEVKNAGIIQKQPQEQTMSGHQNLQVELQHALEWQIKAQRVSEYSQYLRSMASSEAKHRVQSTASMSGLGGSVQHIGDMNTDMMDGGY